MPRLTIRSFVFVALAVFVMSISPARAEEQIIQQSDIYVTSDSYSIHVSHKTGTPSAKVPVLLIHGTWGNALTWDFPGRSVMDRLAAEGYDVYALDLRGMGGSTPPPRMPSDYFPVDIPGRVRDATAVATYIKNATGRVPVVIGWSQGGVIAGLLAASDTQHQLVAGLGLLSVAPSGFVIPTDLLPAVPAILFSEFPKALPPSQSQIDEIIFGTNPITGQSTISPDALATFSAPPILQPDSSIAVVEEVNLCPLSPPVVPVCPAQTVPWGSITVPVLVADGALDRLVGTQLSQALFNALTGTTNKHLVIFPFNSHGWFLEDNHNLTMLAVDLFLFQFRSWQPD